RRSSTGRNGSEGVCTTAPQLGPIQVVRDARLDGGQVARTRVAVWWAGLPPWGQALAVYSATRLVGLLILGATARFQVASPWTKASPGYLDFITMWDGDWYRHIAESGIHRRSLRIRRVRLPRTGGPSTPFTQ